MSLNSALGCRSGLEQLGIGQLSHYDYAFGSSMNLPIQGIKPCPACQADVTGSKRFRPGFYEPGLKVCGKCSTIDPTNACTYFQAEVQKTECVFGFARDHNNYQSPYDGNRFAQFRWG